MHVTTSTGMIYREYGKTGKKVSLLGFGGMRFGAVDNRELCAEMMVEAGEAGVNYFDTAPGYAKGKSEEAFGEGFRQLSARKLPFYCATKTFKTTEAEVRTEIETQLKRLGLDAIDFYHVWCVTSLEDWRKRKAAGVIEAFRKLKDEGLVRHICVSSHLIGDEIKELLMEDLFEGVLFGYSAYNFNARQKAFDAIASRSLGCVVMNPLGGGLIPQHPEVFEFIKTRVDQTVIEAALRFLYSHERISSVLVGFQTIEQVREAVKTLQGFTPIDAAEIERMKKGLGEAFAEICTGCQYCDSCPEGIHIPKLMDAYNFKKLKGTDQALLQRLAWHWSVPASEAAKCTECGRCEELCTQHLPIISRMAEISKIEPSKA